MLDQLEMVYYFFQVITHSDLGENELSIQPLLCPVNSKKKGGGTTPRHAPPLSLPLQKAAGWKGFPSIFIGTLISTMLVSIKKFTNILEFETSFEYLEIVGTLLFC